MTDLISRQAAIDAFAIGEELLKSALDQMYVVGNAREKYEFGIGLIESYIADMKGLPSAQRWTPVSDGLPEYGERVLVTFHNKYIDRTTIGVSRCYMQKEGFFSDQPFDYAAVAWMPLPEPYKEGNDE